MAKRSQLDSLQNPAEHDVEFINSGKAVFYYYFKIPIQMPLSFYSSDLGTRSVNGWNEDG